MYLDVVCGKFVFHNKLDNAWRYKDLKLYSMGKEYLYDQRHNRGQRVFLEYWTGQEHEEAWNLLVTCCWLSRRKIPPPPHIENANVLNEYTNLSCWRGLQTHIKPE